MISKVQPRTRLSSEGGPFGTGPVLRVSARAELISGLFHSFDVYFWL